MYYRGSKMDMRTDGIFLRIRDLTKRYGNSTVLDGVSLNVLAGETRCIIGASGSGKSSLLRCINALNDFDGGTIVIGDHRIGYVERRGRLTPWSRKEAARFRSKIGFVSQHINLFSHRTVLDNVMEGPVHVLGKDISQAKLDAKVLLDRVGLISKLDSYPSQLSGGQQQRAAIARALAMQPEIMLFDEATSALDPESAREVLDVMRTLALGGLTMIVVTHDMDFAARIADSVTVMDGGRVIEEGDSAEIFERPKSTKTKAMISNHN
jgi:polar amino acid transport system ATP-binding protein